MSKLRKALALSATDWLLIAEAWMWFGAVEVGLSCLSLKKLLPILRRSGRQRTCAKEEGAPCSIIPERAAFCVELAARLPVLDSTCLTKAMVLFALLTRQGFDPQILIGVAKAPKGQLDGHAWLECEGRVLLGEPESGRYSSLCVLSRSALRATQIQTQATS